jgi:peptide/nickel transport system ATP-binding protein
MINKPPLLSVHNLTLNYHTRKGPVSAIAGVSFELGQGQSLGLVGESGCGKTSLAMTLLRLLPENARIAGGEIRIEGVDLLQMSEAQVRDVRWARIAMVFQAAMNALDPIYTVGDQILEAIYRHQAAANPDEARERVAQLFQLVGIDPKMTARYPHEFSGGMRQRAVIAMALACSPALIIADEPTTALDVIVQDQVLRELRRIQKALNMSMIYISHDIAVIAEVAERIGVMYAGKLVEIASCSAIFKAPRHPYTAALMSSFPSIRGPKVRLEVLGGEPPDLLNPPRGCRFHPRCPRMLEQCRHVEPVLQASSPDHWSACWNPIEVLQ